MKAENCTVLSIVMQLLATFYCSLDELSPDEFRSIGSRRHLTLCKIVPRFVLRTVTLLPFQFKGPLVETNTYCRRSKGQSGITIYAGKSQRDVYNIFRRKMSCNRDRPKICTETYGWS